MRTSLYWTRRVLLAFVVVLISMQLVLFLAKFSGVDIQQFKLPVVFFGGVLLMLCFPLAIACLILQIAVFSKDRRFYHNG